jgi:hypothetical protein
MREKWRRTRVWITNRGPVRCTPSIEEAIQIPHIAKGRAATLLERIYGQYISVHIRLLSHIRSVRFDERSYWSLTTPVGIVGLILYCLFFRKIVRLYAYPFNAFIIEEKKVESFLFRVLFNFFAWCALLWSGTPPSAPSRYHLSTIFWNQYIIWRRALDL